jgi:predicted ATPase
MITRIEIDGFKSFQGFALDLDPFSALVGPNGAGKSNLLDTLSLLARIADGDLATAFGQGRGRLRDQLSRREPSAAVPDWGSLGRMTFAVELLRFRPTVGGDLGEVPLQATRLRYEVVIELQQLTSGRERFVIIRESLRALTQSPDRWMDRHPRLSQVARYGLGRAFFAYGDRGSDLTVDDPSAPAFASRDVIVQYVPEAAFLSRPDLDARSPHLRAVAEELRGIRVLNLEARELGAPSERSAHPVLTAEGANLPAVLASKSSAVLAQIRADLVSLVPGVRNFEVIADQDALYVEIESSDGQRFHSRVLSDGTLRVLGLSTLLRTSAPGAVVAIEEPENGLHPTRVRALIDRLRQATPSGAGDGALEAVAPSPQVILTSHSPVVLAALMDYPECIVCFDLVRQGKGLRRTRARKVAPPGEIDRAQYVSFGELQRTLDLTKAVDPGEP